MREILKQARDALLTIRCKHQHDQDTWRVALDAVAAVEQALTPPAVEAAVFGGLEYVEAPETSACRGCVFHYEACGEAQDAFEIAFGGHCGDRHVIYIRKE